MPILNIVFRITFIHIYMFPSLKYRPLFAYII